MSPISLFRHQNSIFVTNIMVATRDPGTKTDQDRSGWTDLAVSGSLVVTQLWGQLVRNPYGSHVSWIGLYNTVIYGAKGECPQKSLNFQKSAWSWTASPLLFIMYNFQTYCLCSVVCQTWYFWIFSKTEWAVLNF